MDGHETRLLALLGFGEIEGAKVELEAMGSLAQELRQPSHEWLLGVYRAMLALLEGRLAEAESLISGARRLGEHAQSWNATVSYRLQLYVLRRAQGRLIEVEDLVRHSVDEYPTYPIWRCLVVHMTAELGDPAVAREAFAALAAEDFAGVTSDEGWLVNMGFLAEAASTLGDAERASVLYRQLLRYGDRVAITYAEISTGSVARSLGLLAATMGRLDDAQRHFEDALALNRRIAARPYLAHTQDDYARMLLARGRPGDGERARTLIAAALVTYRQLGMETWADALALEQGLGAHRSAG